MLEKKISKNEINKAWKVLQNMESFSLDEQKEAIEILSFFRWIHTHPMFNFRIFLQNKCKNIWQKNALISQRLKRRPSIIKKLELNENMALSTMQDIWWLRVVLNDIKDIEKLRNEIRKWEENPAFKNTFIKEYDYITTAKSSWYRSLHLIYKYDKNITKEEECRIEIQIRTKVQHAWATAVEVMGTYLNEPLKQSIWSDDFLDLFKDISLLFQKVEEKTSIDSVFLENLKNRVESTRLIEILHWFSTWTKFNRKIFKWKKDHHFLLIILDTSNKTIWLEWFSKKNLDKANLRYSELEQESRKWNKEIVLVSVNSIKKLEKLYPNYFLDTKDFLSILKENIQNKKS